MIEHIHALPSGTRLNQYEFVSVLGAGGFGITYMARDTSLDTIVAIKEYLPGDLAVRQEDASVTAKATTHKDDFDWGLDRFLNEARTLAKFRHPNIVRVNQIFQANNTAYLVMDYARGRSLEDVLKGGTLTEDQTKAILTPILDGLRSVHEQGFLHRDIKPANILLRDGGETLLIDFGAARQAMEARGRGLTSIVTEGYAPLEQYHGTGNQGPWTDIYAVGAVAYKCLTGSKPPPAAARVRNDPLVPIAIAAKCNVSETFAAAVGAALNVDEHLRPQSIADFTAMIAGTKPVPAAPGAEPDVTRAMGTEPVTQWQRPTAVGSPIPAPSGKQGVRQGPAGVSASGPTGHIASADVHQASRRNVAVSVGIAAMAMLAIAGAWYMQDGTDTENVAAKLSATSPPAAKQDAAPIPNVAAPPAPSAPPPAPPSASNSVVVPPAPLPGTPPVAPPSVGKAVVVPPAPVPGTPPPAPPSAGESVVASPAPLTGPPPPTAKAPARPAVTMRTSFDCRTASNSAQRIVCSDSQLAALDIKVAELYQLGLRSVADQNAFRGEQLGWLEQRNECSNKACLTESYGERIKELERWVGP